MSNQIVGSDMRNKPFGARLRAAMDTRGPLCVGIDPHQHLLDAWGLPDTAEGLASFTYGVVDALADRVAVFKPQSAFFERFGSAGIAVLEQATIRLREAGALVIIDAKRGDIGTTMAGYAAAYLAEKGPLACDALTVSPYLGADSLAPFVDAARAAGAGLFVLVRTSNPGAADFLDADTGAGPLHERIARVVDGLADRLAGSGAFSGAGAVIGATEPRFLDRLRELMPRAIFLLPGVGAQGGSAAALGGAFAGPGSALVTASRSIASAPDPAVAAEELRAQVWSIAGG